MKRNDIITMLNHQPKTFFWYDKLLLCLNCENTHEADAWFAGIIASLYYRPNKTVLVLEYDGETSFFEELFDPRMYCKCDAIDAGERMYDNLIMNVDFEKKDLNMPTRDNFRIVDIEFGMVEADKRLASYCSIQKFWSFPKRKDFIVLSPKSIDEIALKSIDKLELWIEIFNKFKPKDK